MLYCIKSIFTPSAIFYLMQCSSRSGVPTPQLVSLALGSRIFGTDPVQKSLRPPRPSGQIKFLNPAHREFKDVEV